MGIYISCLSETDSHIFHDIWVMWNSAVTVWHFLHVIFFFLITCNKWSRSAWTENQRSICPDNVLKDTAETLGQKKNSTLCPAAQSERHMERKKTLKSAEQIKWINEFCLYWTHTHISELLINIFWKNHWSKLFQTTPC